MEKFLLVALLLTGSYYDLAGKSKPENARLLVAQSLQAMGGMEKLKALHHLSLSGIGHTYMLEQSERPEGPWIVNYQQVRQLRDYRHQRLHTTRESRNTQQPAWSPVTTVYAEGTVAVLTPNGEYAPGRATMAEEAKEALQLAPEQVLLAAHHAPDLQQLADTLIQGVPHQGVAFRLQQNRVKLYLNRHTHLPTLLSSTRAFPQDLMWSVWGDVRSDMYYSFWSLQPEGLYYPLQYNLHRNGQPYQELTVLTLQINPAVPADTFAMPQQVKEQFAAQPLQDFNALPLGRPDRPAQELAPGLMQIPGYWNVAVIRQDDGVVLLEAPISGGYTAKALAEAKRLYPDLKMKAVISTSDAWPHLAGVREAVAQKLPVYLLQENKPILQRLVSAPFASHPDQLEKHRQKPLFKAVGGKTVLGKGANRMELYPIRGEAGERMMMVYFPEHRLLYASDLVQLMRDGSFFQPAYVAEVVAAVKREGLQVKRVFAMHTGVIPYSRLLEAVATASASGSQR
ncbi:MAG: hypothetical protein LPK14_05640 [Hymenobacteraceae bacterium]|nr:hypothetical protein [Hymenobacteraceae bacterium]